MMTEVLGDFLRGRTVLICDGCGKGFLAMPPGRVDIDPRWRIMWRRGGGRESGICGGAILAVDINKAMRLANKAATGGKIDV